MDTEDKLAEMLPMIKRVAKKVASEHPILEADDLEQELVLMVIQRGDSLPAQSEVEWSVQSFLTKVARTYGFKMKQQHYMIDPNISYQVSEIKDILTTHFNPDDWDYVREGESVETRVAEHSDVAWALDRLSPEEKAFVAECYSAERLPKANTKEYRNLRAVIIKIANIVNSYTRRDEGNGPGRRKAVSNSHGQQMIDAPNSSISYWIR